MTQKIKKKLLLSNLKFITLAERSLSSVRTVSSTDRFALEVIGFTLLRRVKV